MAGGGIYHDPPRADELPERIQRLCDFANGKTPAQFIPPVIRAIMLHSGFWLFEYISISNILLKAPVQYEKSFLYTETDDNDLNYFILHQADTIRQALEALHAYIERKQPETRDAEKRLHALPQFNPRRQAVILHALRHPGQEYTMTSHGSSHQVAYATARADLMDLCKHGLLTMKKRGKTFVFEPSPDIARKLESMG